MVYYGTEYMTVIYNSIRNLSFMKVVRETAWILYVTHICETENIFCGWNNIGTCGWV